MSLCHGSAGLRLLGGMASRGPHGGDAPSRGCTSLWDASSCIIRCLEEGRSLRDISQCPYHGKCSQTVLDPAERDALDPRAPSPASQSSAGARARSVKARRFVPRRTHAGFAFATVNPNSSWSVGQLSWEECFWPHGALGLARGRPTGTDAGEGCRSWRCKDTWGSLAQPMLLPGPGQQSRGIWIHLFSPIEFVPRIPTFYSFWQYLV